MKFKTTLVSISVEIVAEVPDGHFCDAPIHHCSYIGCGHYGGRRCTLFDVHLSDIPVGSGQVEYLEKCNRCKGAVIAIENL